jgi:hypothetical protein
MKEPKILIYRFLERYDGTSPEPIDSYDPRQLGGHVPAVGDLIIDPSVPEGWDRGNPEARRIYEVTARYFWPATDVGDVRIALVVRARQGRREEISIFGYSNLTEPPAQ